MKKRSHGILLVLLLLLISLAAGCGGSRPTAGEGDESGSVYPITVRDAAGRDVTIAAEPKRVISVAPSNTELMFALGKGDILVGRSDFCDYPAEALAIESIGGFFPPNYEKILSLEPDLVLMVDGTVEAREKLEQEYGLTTLVIDPGNFEEMYEGIMTLGKAVNAREAAQQLVAQIQAEVAAIEEKTAQVENKPVVVYQVWADPLMVAGPGSYIDDMIRIAGGINAAAGASGAWAEFPVEQLFEADPDLIVTNSPTTAQESLERKGWESLKAVREGKVVGLPDESIVVRPGPRLIQGLHWFAEQLHPELFAQ